MRRSLFFRSIGHSFRKSKAPKSGPKNVVGIPQALQTFTTLNGQGYVGCGWKSVKGSVEAEIVNALRLGERSTASHLLLDLGRGYRFLRADDFVYILRYCARSPDPWFVTETWRTMEEKGVNMNRKCFLLIIRALSKGGYLEEHPRLIRLNWLILQVEPGHTVLVHAAAGRVGSLLCQWANALGATVMGTVSTKEKVAQAKDDGCHHIILYKEEDFVTRVNEITSGKGVQVVYDSVGKDTFQGSLTCLKSRGYMVSFGQSSGTPDPVPLSALAAKSLFLTRHSLMQYTETCDELLGKCLLMLHQVCYGSM